MTKTKQLVLTAMFTAIIVLMAATPLGYLHAGIVDITFLTIPVIIGAIVLGEKLGAFLGLMFGLTSFGQCFGILGSSPFGMALLAVNPVYTLILCIVPRVLMGYLCGLIFHKLYTSDLHNAVAFSVASLSGALLNTILFVTVMMLFFGNSEYIQNMQAGKNIFVFLSLFVGINGLIEAAASYIIASTISAVIYKFAGIQRT